MEGPRRADSGGYVMDRTWTIGLRTMACVGVVALGLAVACTSRRGVDGGDDDGPKGTYIDEPVILAYSGPILPSEQIENEYVFDLSQDTLVTSRRYNDILVRYRTVNSCDRLAEVWDNVRQEWRPISWHDSGGCFHDFTTHRHMLSAVGIDAGTVVDSAGRMRIRVYGPYNLWIWTLELHPEYYMIPVSAEAPYPYGRVGLAYGNGHLYVTTGAPPLICEVDASGAILSSFSPPIDKPFGLTFDGEHLWLIGAPDSLFQIRLHGQVVCRFPLPTIWHGDLAWDGETLWLAEEAGQDPHLLAIDPVASCALGEAVITASFPRPGHGRAPGLTWDGSHLLLVCDSLYRITWDGDVSETQPLPFADFLGAAWDGSRLCVVYDGPPGPSGWPTDDWVIACFKLR